MKKKNKIVVVLVFVVLLILFVFQMELLKMIIGISLILSPFIIIIWACVHKWDKHTAVSNIGSSDDSIFDDEPEYNLQKKVSHIEKKTTTTNTNTTVTTETIYFKGDN